MRMGTAMVPRPNRLLHPETNSSNVCDYFPCFPPPPPPAQESSTNVGFHHNSLIPALPIAAACFIAAAVLVLVLAVFVLRRRRRRRASATAAPDEGPGPFEDGGGGDVDHHVWYIRTTGLDESTIRAITAWAYKAEDGVLGASSADCSVCLSEFRDGELVRLLPKCGHAFHLRCIDTWLRSHVNCPLCRAPVVPPATTASAADPGTSSPSFSSALSSPDSAFDLTDPNSASSAPVDSNHIDGQQSETGRGALEVETEVGRMELGGGNPIAIDQIPNSELGEPSDIGEHGFQPIRRSFSLGSLTGAPSMHRTEMEEGPSDNTKGSSREEDWNERTWRKRGNASSGTTSLQKETERSSSSASGRFFLSRHGRARSSLLPL